MTPTTRRRFLLLAGTASAVGLAGCGAQSEPPAEDPPRATATERPAPTSGPASTPTATPGQAFGDLSVDMITDNQGSYFQPKGLLLEPGTTVRFVNEKGVHTATAYHPDNGDLPLRIPEGAAAFDSGILTEQGAVFEVTFDVPGVWDIVCLPHESLGMVGRFVVGEPGDGPGTSELTDVPPLAKQTMPTVEAILADGVVDGP